MRALKKQLSNGKLHMAKRYNCRCSSPHLIVLEQDGLGQVLSTSTWDARAVWLSPHGVRWTAPFLLDMSVERKQLIVAWDGAENVSERSSKVLTLGTLAM